MHTATRMNLATLLAEIERDRDVILYVGCARRCGWHGYRKPTTALVAPCPQCGATARFA